MFNFNHGGLGNTLGVNTGLTGLTGLTGVLQTLDWKQSPLNSYDDIRSGYQNVSHYYSQQSFSRLLLPRRSHYTVNRY